MLLVCAFCASLEALRLLQFLSVSLQRAAYNHVRPHLFLAGLVHSPHFKLCLSVVALTAEICILNEHHIVIYRGWALQ